MRISWFIALQFLREYRAQTALTICAVSVGVAVMIFLSALITGLQESLIEKTLGTQAHITLRPPEEQPSPQYIGEAYARRVQTTSQRLHSLSQWQAIVRRVERDSDVRASAAIASGDGFAQRGNATRPVAILASRPQDFDAVIPFSKHLVEGEMRLDGAEAAIGTRLAADLGVAVGDKVRLSTPDGLDSLVSVRAIFDLGNQQVNQRWVILPLRTGQALLGLPGGANLIYLRTLNIFDAESVARRLENSTGVDAESWMETNQQLLVALRSQSSSSYTIQFFIFVAVAMGIASVLVVSVVQRTREIGILRAMGIPRAAVFWVFVMQGALVGWIGFAVGALLGAGLSQVFSRLAPAPDGSATFPMALSPGLFAFAAAAATLTGIVAAALPARRAARLDPVEAIRHA